MAALRWMALSLVLLVIFVIETASGLTPSILGFKIDVMIFFISSVALFCGAKAGCVFGFAAGVLMDLSFSGVEGLFPLFFMIFGAVSGVLSEIYLRKLFQSMLFISAVCFLVLNFIVYICYYWLVYGVTVFSAMAKIIPEFLISAVFSPIPYFAVKKITERFPVL